MKIATFNINNINRRLDNLLAWLRSARPDIACLQELKASDNEFPLRAIEKAGYRAVFRGQQHGPAKLPRNQRLAWLFRPENRCRDGLGTEEKMSCDGFLPGPLAQS